MEESQQEYYSPKRIGLGFFIPIIYLWNPFGKPVEVHRCQTDGGIVLRTQSSLSLHPGHRIAQPVLMHWWEILLVWIGVIK